VRVALGGSLLLIDRGPLLRPCARCGRSSARLDCRRDGVPICLACALDAAAATADAVLDVGALAPPAPGLSRWTHSEAHSSPGAATRPSRLHRRQ
jgi:hypothetical protein